MKKVLITESQLRTMVRKMLMEEMPNSIGTVNTSVETNFEKNININPVLQRLLKGVTNINQLNGIFKDIIEHTLLVANKNQIMTAINTAFNEIDMKDGSKDNMINLKKDFQTRANMGSNLEESRIRRKKRF